MEADAEHHRGDVADYRHRAPAVRCGEAADRHHGGKMVEADDRMAEAGQQPLPERRGLTTAHDVMRKGGVGNGESGERDGDFLEHGRPPKTAAA
jgi:hypothetical protein